MANRRHPSAKSISACSMMSTMAKTLCSMTNKKHSMDVQSRAKRSAPYGNAGINTPHAIIASSAAINKNLFTGLYAYALIERFETRGSPALPSSRDSSGDFSAFSFFFSWLGR